MKSAKFTLIAIVCAACVISAVAQQFQAAVPSAIDVSVYAAGAKEFWAFGPGTGFEVYAYNPSLNAMQLKANIGGITSMSIGGGSAVQDDEEWMLEEVNYLWRYDTPTRTAQLVNTSNAMRSVVVGPGYADGCHPYEVWVTYNSGLDNIWFAARYNYCTKALEEPGITAVPGGPSKIATGNGEVWALNTANQVFRFNPATNSFVKMAGSLTQLTVGIDGVWGLNAAGNIYEFNPVTQAFNLIPGSLATISAGGDGIWGINSSHQVYRYEASTRSFFAVAGPQLFGNVAVGTGGGVWSTDSLGNPQVFVP